MPPTFYRGCWHVVSRELSCTSTVIIVPYDRSLQPEGLLSFTRRRCIRVSPHCAISPTAAPPVGVWAVSQSQCGPSQPLSPATNRRLGGPLPHQLANWTRVHPQANKSFYLRIMRSPWSYAVLAVVSKLLSPTRGQVTHALLTRSPLSIKKQAPQCSVRLACVRRAASVRPEPGSKLFIKWY